MYLKISKKFITCFLQIFKHKKNLSIIVERFFNFFL